MAQELEAVQHACMGGAKLMRHCRRCRADAVGLLGEDRSDEFPPAKIEQMEVVYDLDERRAYQSQVEVRRQAQHEAKQAAISEEQAADGDADLELLMAVASEGQGRVNRHFGHASDFQIYAVSATEAVFVGHHRVDLYCQGGYAEDEQLPSIVNAINGCHAVLVARISACPRDELTAAGIEPVDEVAHEFIERAALQWLAAGRLPRAHRRRRAGAPAAR